MEGEGLKCVPLSFENLTLNWLVRADLGVWGISD